MSWSDALVRYATAASPADDIPADVYLTHNDHFTVIADKFPKSTVHCLVLPRAPFPLRPTIGSPPLNVQQLTSLQALLKLPKETVLHVFGLLEEMLEEVVERIEERLRKEHGWDDGVVDVRWGFHAVPSMKRRVYTEHRHVHLHVMTSDLVAPALKNKKHYNSFSPQLGFWLPLETVKSWVEHDDKESMSLPPAKYEPLLKGPLVSHLTGETFPTMPKLKLHLAAELEKAARKATAKGKH